MDVALTPPPSLTGVPVVMDHMAREVLAAPACAAALGDVTLAPHQIDAASRLLAILDRDGGALLADVTGLGKTYVALAVGRSFKATLVVAPAALRPMWSDARHRARVDAAFVSYEELSRGANLAGAAPDLLVLDEAHHARNTRARRYGAIADLAWRTRVLMLTATPIHNRLMDVRALLALFLGFRAWSLKPDEIARHVVRRAAFGRLGTLSLSSARQPSLPSIDKPRWLQVPPDPETLRAIAALPPAVPLSNGGAAHALVQLGLVRAWASSAAALRAVLERRLQRSTAILSSIAAGRLPTRGDLAGWFAVDGAVQLGFPELLVDGMAPRDVGRLRDTIEAHVAGVRAILHLGDGPAGPDPVRAGHLQAILAEHATEAVVAFTQFADTAEAMFRTTVACGGVALVTGRGSRIASGPVQTQELLPRFDIATSFAGVVRSRALPMHLLIATDMLSEGVSLRRARALIHLDLPWTLARLEQRVGRLRRIGSPYARILVYAIGPPAGARELMAVVRALNRKARVSAIIASPEAPMAIPLLGTRLHQVTRMVSERSDIRAAESIRAELTTWLTGATSPVTSGELRMAVLPDRGQSGWTALALVRQATGPVLLGISSAGATDRPSEVLPVVRAVGRRARGLVPARTDAGVAPATGRVVDVPCLPHIEAALARLAAWLTLQRARGLAAPVTAAPSAAHASALRFLDGIVTGARRADLPGLLPLVDRCRRLVLAARGIGAEWALERWLATVAQARRLSAEGELASLAHLLEQAQPRRECDPAGEAAVVAVLVMT